MRIYTEASAIYDQEAALSFKALIPEEPSRSLPADDPSLAHFCDFVDFYTRKTIDPINTSLACEKQAEAVRMTAEDATPENLRLLMDTMLEVIDHLEKKWLDEQIRHEDRQRQHREDVARLSQQIRELQPESRKPSRFYERGMQWISGLFGRVEQPAARKTPRRTPTRRHGSVSVVNV